MTAKKISPASIARYEQWQEWAVLAIQKEDKRAYRALLEDLSKYSASFIGSKLLKQEWIDDVVQTILVSVHKALPSYSPDRPIKPWIDSIIRFRLNDALRKHYASQENPFEDVGEKISSGTDVTFSAYQNELKEDMIKALATLPEKQRRVVEMTKIMGYSIEETAKEMGLSQSAVKVRVHRALKSMRAFLSDSDVFYEDR